MSLIWRVKALDEKHELIQKDFIRREAFKVDGVSCYVYLKSRTNADSGHKWFSIYFRLRRQAEPSPKLRVRFHVSCLRESAFTDPLEYSTTVWDRKNGHG